MGQFFKPLRRKIGVVTLMMACVFAAGWVRSFHLIDCVQWDSVCWTAQGNLYLWPPDLFPMTWEWPSWYAREFDIAVEESRFNSIRWKWRFMGFGMGDFPVHVHISFPFVLIPFWSIVIPLTLLSAWLLLSKPREVTPDELKLMIVSRLTGMLRIRLMILGLVVWAVALLFTNVFAEVVLSKTSQHEQPISIYVESTIGGKALEIPWLIAFFLGCVVGPIVFLIVVVRSVNEYSRLKKTFGATPIE